MRQRDKQAPQSAEETVRDIRRATRRRLAGDTAREATSDEVKTLRADARQLKEALAEVTLENRLHARQDRHPQDDVLRLARSLRRRGLRRVERPQAAAQPRLEPHLR